MVIAQIHPCLLIVLSVSLLAFFINCHATSTLSLAVPSSQVYTNSSQYVIVYVLVPDMVAIWKCNLVSPFVSHPRQNVSIRQKHFY